MTENNKTRRSQLNATRRWEKKNPERTKYMAARRQARSFIRNYATKEDLDELEKLIEEKRKNL